jgi:hypothetical protein
MLGWLSWREGARIKEWEGVLDVLTTTLLQCIHFPYIWFRYERSNTVLGWKFRLKALCIIETESLGNIGINLYWVSSHNYNIHIVVITTGFLTWCNTSVKFGVNPFSFPWRKTTVSESIFLWCRKWFAFVTVHSPDSESSGFYCENQKRCFARSLEEEGQILPSVSWTAHAVNNFPGLACI